MKKRSSWLWLMMGVVFLTGLIVFSLMGKQVSAASQDTEVVKKNPMSEVVKMVFDAMGDYILDVTAGIGIGENEDGERVVYSTDNDQNLIAASSQVFNYVTFLPVSASGQARLIAQDLGLEVAPEVSAQGYGYSSLEPLLEAWRVFRNVAYVFFTLVILGIGIMILFQNSFDGQVVVTVQKALPRIILAIILVTFSYAIVGLLIDAMYVLMFLFAGILPEVREQATELMGKNIFQVMLTMLGGGISNVWEIFWGIGTMGVGENIGDTFGSVGGFIGWLLIDVILGALLSSVLSIIMTIIVIVVILVNTWKLFMTLIKSYLIIILDVIFAPIMLMLGAFPNSKSFKQWFNSLIGNLSGFVTVFVILMVYAFLNSIEASGTGAQSELFVPPYVIGFGNVDVTSVALSVLGLAIIITLPELVKKVQKKLGAESGWLGEMAQSAGESLKQSASGIGGRAAGLAAAPLVAAAGSVGRTIASPIQGLTEGWSSRKQGGKFSDGFKAGTSDAVKKAWTGDKGYARTTSTLFNQLPNVIENTAKGGIRSGFQTAMGGTADNAYEVELFKKTQQIANNMLGGTADEQKRAKAWQLRNPNAQAWKANSYETPDEQSGRFRRMISRLSR